MPSFTQWGQIMKLESGFAAFIIIAAFFIMALDRDKE